MKTNLPILLLLLCLCAPLRAQVPSLDPNADTNTQPPPSPARDIMPQTINHKPNPTAPPAELASQIDKFFKTLKGDSNADDFYADAYDTFLADSRLGKQVDKKSAIISRTKSAFGLYGKLHDYEIYDNYSVGSNLLVLTYLTRHDLAPLRWRFIFYRPDKTWTLINMGFDDNLLDTLD